jgi:FkbM family methyltransferase
MMASDPQKMNQKLSRWVKTVLRRFDVGVMRYSNLQKVLVESEAFKNFPFFLSLPQEQLPELLGYIYKSRSQLWQDLFVISELGFKKNGYFVEFGATNGVDLSNSYLLETDFGWKGILAEPARCWHRDLRSNRKARIEEKCVWQDSSSTLSFNEVAEPELSTIDDFSATDTHRELRQKGKTYDVGTISLLDMLVKYGAPTRIDYLSIDTEGSEFEILNAFDFDRFHFSVITCEHNFTPAREKIRALLGRNGYTRKFAEF